MFVITLKTLANALRLVFLAGIALAPVSLCICEPGASALRLGKNWPVLAIVPVSLCICEPGAVAYSASFMEAIRASKSLEAAFMVASGPTALRKYETSGVTTMAPKSL